MNKIIKMIIAILFFCAVGCSDPNHINGKYMATYLEIADKPISNIMPPNTLKSTDINNDQFYVTISKGKIVEVSINGETYVGNFEGKGTMYNTSVTWASENGPATYIIPEFRVVNSGIGFSDGGKLTLNFYLSTSSIDDWKYRMTIEFINQEN